MVGGCAQCTVGKHEQNAKCLPAQTASRLTIALAGNPNSGKTTVFNALTGLRQKIANYPGVTVEKKVGLVHLPDQSWANVIDLPGTYSLVSRSPDERVASDVLRGQRADTPPPDAVIAVVDASNLQRNLYLVSQLIELGHPLVVALNMTDVAERRQVGVDAKALSRSLGVPVVPVVAHKRQGIHELLHAISGARVAPIPEWPMLEATNGGLAHPIDPMQAKIEAHYRWIEGISAACGVHHNGHNGSSNGTAATAHPQATTPRVHISDRIDAVLIHRVWGLLVFISVMAMVFASMFWLAKPLQDLLSGIIDAAGAAVSSRLPGAALQSLVQDGIFAGVGSVIVFVPQIAILFLLLAVLEDSGYLARASFLMDHLLAKVGLHGKSFVPLLSGFACAIPGIMATRTIEDRKGRLATILVLPFMTCSARLPVYGLLVGTFFASLGAVRQAGIMILLYLLGIAFAAGTALIFRRTLLRGADAGFILELPSYKVPQLSVIGRQVASNSWKFLSRAGTTIFAICVVIWVVSYYPRLPEAQASRFTEASTLAAAQQEYSLVGRLGHAIEPVIRPLGFDWKMGVGCIGAFAAREVFVSTMAIVYGTGGEEESADLGAAMRADRYPDGSLIWTPLVAASLLLWFVIAMQCLSTVMVVRQETGGWKWALFMLGYMNVLGYVACLLFYQIGSRLFGG